MHPRAVALADISCCLGHGNNRIPLLDNGSHETVRRQQAGLQARLVTVIVHRSWRVRCRGKFAAWSDFEEARGSPEESQGSRRAACKHVVIGR